MKQEKVPAVMDNDGHIAVDGRGLSELRLRLLEVLAARDGGGGWLPA